MEFPESRVVLLAEELDELEMIETGLDHFGAELLVLGW